jgi:hypothetical protein
VHGTLDLVAQTWAPALSPLGPRTLENQHFLRCVALALLLVVTRVDRAFGVDRRLQNALLLVDDVVVFDAGPFLMASSRLHILDARSLLAHAVALFLHRFLNLFGDIRPVSAAARKALEFACRLLGAAPSSACAAASSLRLAHDVCCCGIICCSICIDICCLCRPTSPRSMLPVRRHLSIVAELSRLHRLLHAWSTCTTVLLGFMCSACD